MFCVKCGKEIEDEAVFCPFCGANLTMLLEEGSKSNIIQSVEAEESHKHEDFCCEKANKDIDESREKNKKSANHTEKNRKFSGYTVIVILLSVLLMILIALIKADIFGVGV